MSDQFKCDRCGGMFDKEWSDEEAAGEFRQAFGRDKTSDDATVCDDCYKKIMDNANRTLANPN